jgi:5,10-methenyltetrahydrofolate synthetase
VDIAAWRRETRARLIQERSRIPPEEHQQASLAIVGRLEALLADFPARTISAYLPYKGEVDLRVLMERLRARGWITALPSVVGPRQPLEFRQWGSNSEMDPGVYGIPVPRERNLVTPDIIVTPLVAFDAAKYRLGYGAGYFDITLASLHPRPVAIGVGFEMGSLETIHPLDTDIPMEFIVTESAVR